MPALQLLIKPASSLCNLNCSYCFYLDEADQRETASEGIMSSETLEALVKQACEEAEGELTLAFQGGEPTLAGLPFFEHLIELEAKYKPDDLVIHHALQTNGFMLDGKWSRFLKEHNFLVGVSLDGTRGLHDRYRLDKLDEGSFSRVWRNIALLQEFEVDFNILTVVTAPLAKRIGAVYRFFKEHNLPWQQYIPCLSPLKTAEDTTGTEDPEPDWHLSAEAYGDFLCELFDLWYADVTRGQPIYIRTFENWVGMLLGQHPESCGLAGVCSPQHVVEANGDIYPCDFYCLDAYKLGNIRDEGMSFTSLARSACSQAFMEESLPLPTACQTCEVRQFCRGGCKRDRFGFDFAEGPPAAEQLTALRDGQEVQVSETGEVLDLNRYCSGYKRFFRCAGPRLNKLAMSLRR